MSSIASLLIAAAFGFGEKDKRLNSAFS